jgi:D-glycero-alpha-D-manno-heptose 1-phosphate guanylyltransferase
MNSNINIFILAGGFGTRLQSVITDVPKPMAPIHNKPFLCYQIQEIRKYFKNEPIYLLTYYLSEIIEEYFKEDKSITIIKENEPLGTGGSIKHAIKFLGLKNDTSILIFNGDTYIKPNLHSMLKKNSEEIIILGSLQNICDRYGVLEIKDERIVNFIEKEKGICNSYINAGCYFFKNLSFFDSIKENIFAIEDKFKEYLSTHPIGVFSYDGVFIDIGIPEDYNKMINMVPK